MKVNIDFLKREIHFPQHVDLHKMAYIMDMYFPSKIWGDFKFVIDGRIDEDADIRGKLPVSD